MQFESSEYIVRFAIYTGAFTSLVTLLIVALMLIIRFGRLNDLGARSALKAKWLDVLGGSQKGLQADLLKLPRRSAFHLLRQWIVAYENTRWSEGGNADTRRRHLIEAAHRVRLAELAFEFVESGTNEEVMASAIALGRLKVERAWIPLKRRASAPHAYVSAVAMEALVRIDADRALPVLAETLNAQVGWPDHVLSRILGEMSESQTHKAITAIVAERNFDAVLHLFRALERRGDASAEIVLEWLVDHLRSVDDLIDCCYAALQKERLDAVLKIYYDGMERIQELRQLATDSAADWLSDDEPQWIQNELITDAIGGARMPVGSTHDIP